MPFAPLIRKQLLQALEVHILPVLSGQAVTQVLADSPASFGAVEHWVERKTPLPQANADPIQLIRHWEKLGMVALNMPTLGFVYEGMSYERVGSIAKTRGASSAGIVGLHLAAPGIIFYPTGTPHADGSLSPARRSLAGAKVLAITFMREEVQPFLVQHDSTRNEVTHLLQVRDPLLVKMGEIYLDELRQPDNAPNAQLQLHALMGRLHRYLLQNQPQVCNSSWVEPARFAPAESAPRLQHHEQLGRDITHYVLTHLQMPLSAQTLARHFGISTVQLNRIFQQLYGISPMRYVTQQRIEAAKQILTDTPERISDVARLVGFAGSSSFCTLFARHTGMSPNEYRRESRNSTQRK